MEELQLPNTELALNEYIERVAEAMVNQLLENRSFITGKLANSVRENNYVKDTKDGPVGTITMLWYGEVVDEGIGRKAGGIPPIADIKQWIRNKGIPKPAQFKTVDNFAWAVAKKIGKRGTNPKARPFIENSFELVKTQYGDKVMEQAIGLDLENRLTIAFEKSTK